MSMMRLRIRKIWRSIISIFEVLLVFSSVMIDDILFVVYTDRIKILQDGKEVDVTRLISARFATDFERGMYYGKY